MKAALTVGAIALVGLPLAAWLARPGNGNGGAAAPPTAAATTTRAPSGPSPQPPAPPPHALVLGGEAGPYAVALAAEQSRLTALVLSPAGGGARGLDVRIDGRETTPCGSGCYRVAAAHGRRVIVAVGGRRTSFALPAHPRPAAALVQRVRSLYRSLAGVTYLEHLASGQGTVTVTTWRLERPDRIRYAIQGGPQGIVIGTRRWDRPSVRARWVQSSQIPRLPQPATQWQHATNAWLLAPGVVVSADPSIPAYFRVELDPGTLRLRLRLLRMAAAAHFMSDRYLSFDPRRSIRAPRRAGGARTSR